MEEIDKKTQIEKANKKLIVFKSKYPSKNDESLQEKINSLEEQLKKKQNLLEEIQKKIVSFNEQNFIYQTQQKLKIQIEQLENEIPQYEKLINVGKTLSNNRFYVNCI